MTRLDGGDTEIEEPKDMRKAKGGKGLIHRLSTRRIIPEGDEVYKVLIHLPSFTFRIDTGHGWVIVPSP